MELHYTQYQQVSKKYNTRLLFKSRNDQKVAYDPGAPNHNCRNKIQNGFSILEFLAWLFIFTIFVASSFEIHMFFRKTNFKSAKEFEHAWNKIN